MSDGTRYARQQIDFIDSNPAMDAYRKGQRFDQETLLTDQKIESNDLTNRENRASSSARLRKIQAEADSAVTEASVGRATAPIRVEERRVGLRQQEAVARNTEMQGFYRSLELLNAGDVQGAQEVARMSGQALPPEVVQNSTLRRVITAIAKRAQEIYPDRPAAQQSYIEGQMRGVQDQVANGKPVDQFTQYWMPQGAPKPPEIGSVTQGIPAGFERAPDGGLRPITGGPADPNYIKQKTEASEKEKPRNMSVTDIGKLTEESQKFSDLTRFADTFKPEYAGYASSVAGNAANLIGRNLPENRFSEGASWWQSYDRFKNVTRHELFGSALTATEQSAFEKADISPAMNPYQIKKNLELQKEIVTNGLKRKADAMISAGYDPKTIGAAYGLNLGSIGVDAQGRRGSVAPASAPQQRPAALPQGVSPDMALNEARAAIAAGKDRNAVIQRLQSWGIDPAGL